MRTAVPLRRRSGDVPEPDPGAVVALLLFEAADCLMAVPASEVSRLAPLESEVGASDDGVSASGERIDVGQYFAGYGSDGPWLHWCRGARSASLRVARVVEVFSCEIRALAPMPVRLRAGPFWAIGVRDDDVFLLVDPARLAPPDRGHPRQG